MESTPHDQDWLKACTRLFGCNTYVRITVIFNNSPLSQADIMKKIYKYMHQALAPIDYGGVPHTHRWLSPSSVGGVFATTTPFLDHLLVRGLRQLLRQVVGQVKHHFKCHNWSVVYTIGRPWEDIPHARGTL